MMVDIFPDAMIHYDFLLGKERDYKAYYVLKHIDDYNFRNRQNERIISHGLVMGSIRFELADNVTYAIYGKINNSNIIHCSEPYSIIEIPSLITIKPSNRVIQ